jgi:hypothetical protein
VRYRVEVADRPDALYALWDGQVFQAQRSTADGTILLVTLAGGEAPDSFDTEWNGRRAKVVPENEAAATFSIQTYCRFDDEIFRIEPQSADGELTLRWTGSDEHVAAQLGLTGLTARISDPESITALWQERHDFAPTGSRRREPGTGNTQPLLRAIGRTLLGFLPQGWQRVAAQFRQVGDYSELEVRAVSDDVAVSLSAPPELGQLFAQLRSAMYEAGTGTWMQGTYTLDEQSNFDFDFDTDTEPAWRRPPGRDGRAAARSHDAELEYFPRERKKVPEWLARRAGLSVDVAFRQAKVVDAHNEGEPPVVNRAPVPQPEVRAVLDYLYRAPIAVARPGTLPDVFAPQVPPDVPDAFHTDGVWIWPAAVPHYLRKYGLPPEPELLDHIRAHHHRPPHVGAELRAAAEATVLGRPLPPMAPPPAEADDVRARIDRGGEPGRDLLAGEVLGVLRQRLAESGVAESAYRIGEASPGAWCLRRTEHGWEVAAHDEQGPVDPVHFTRVEQAARFLLGTLLLYPGRARIGVPDEAEAQEPAAHASDWPVLPLRGEPPLSFFQGKRTITLPAGVHLVRFGNESGNLLHPEGTQFATTSLAAAREQERHGYVMRRPVRVLTGVALPWGGLPGGAVSYLLPRAVGHHVDTGALERLG